MPCSAGGDPDGLGGFGRVFVEFGTLEAAEMCARAMDGRYFDGQRVGAGYYDVDDFLAAGTAWFLDKILKALEMPAETAPVRRDPRQPYAGASKVDGEFIPGLPQPDASVGATVNASYHALGGTIHCASAPLSARDTASLEVSLNGQQYTADTLPFVFYREVVSRKFFDVSEIGGFRLVAKCDGNALSACSF